MELISSKVKFLNHNKTITSYWELILGLWSSLAWPQFRTLSMASFQSLTNRGTASLLHLQINYCIITLQHHRIVEGRRDLWRLSEQGQQEQVAHGSVQLGF